jgi:hypothetical protein
MPYIKQEQRDVIDKEIDAFIIDLKGEPTNRDRIRSLAELVCAVSRQFDPAYIGGCQILSSYLVTLYEAVASIPEFDSEWPGILNYILSRVSAGLIGDSKYSRINLMMGILDKLQTDTVPATDDADNALHLRGVFKCMEMELYRRLVAPYENSKIEANGDVY